MVTHYYKLGKKIEAGAAFVTNQVGYDFRKMQELMQWLKYKKYDVPVIGNIYVLSYPAAKLMNNNIIPGCVVTDKLVAQLEEERQAEDKGKAARMLRAAKMYALAKGMGCSGVHIGGHNMNYEMVEYIIDKGEELYPNWQDLVAELEYPQKDNFYFFEESQKKGLNSDKPVERAPKPSKSLMYIFCLIFHGAFFDIKHPFFKGYQKLAKFAEKHRWLYRLVEYIEHISKTAMFGCQNCGDCALFDVAYICPMSQCPKNQRVGPCGGSYEGWCEVYPNEKKCIWVEAYDRLKSFGEEETLGAYTIPPCNWELRETSAWLNFYMGKDHTSKRLGVKPLPDKKEKKTEK